MTYGDGISDVNIKKLLKYHKKNNKVCTLTAVRPPARFGELKITGNSVKTFNEKPQLKEGWINGGFFVFNYKIFKFKIIYVFFGDDWLFYGPIYI